MTSLTHRGAVEHRTRLLPQAQAVRFARALSANSRFAEVIVERSPRAKSEAAFLVRYQPARAERQAELLGSADSTRAARGIGASDLYLFVVDPDTGVILCQSDSGEVYELAGGRCSCPDFEFRCAHTGGAVRCKHLHALDAAKAEGRVIGFETIPAPTVPAVWDESAEERRARVNRQIDRQIDRDFPEFD